jgi:branched-chain amino acid transport system substrate-binding protein
MTHENMSRRRFVGITAAGLSLASMPLSRPARAENKVIRIGFLAPLTGEVAGWGLPGLYGCQVWADEINAGGGVKIGDESYNLEFVGYDDEYMPDKSLQGAKKLVLEDGVKFVMMLGGDPIPATLPFFKDQNMLVSTLAPSDLSPKFPNLVAPAEVHPIYNVTGVDWLARNRPELKRAALCGQNDAIGLPSMATYRAAFKAAGIEVVYDEMFDIATTDFAPVMTAMLAKKPDIVCLDTAYPDFVNLLTEQAFLQGFKGQMLSCTCDNYQNIIDKTSKEFMEGFVFQFPDFDDPAMSQGQINFKDPKAFYDTYVKQYPGSWSAVSWEYAAIGELWMRGAQKAGSVEPQKVLAAMKDGGIGAHVFGQAKWWGTELFGIDNALVGNWPVVVIRNGKATIVELASVTGWWDKHKDVLVQEMTAAGQMWNQRT